MKLSRKGLVLIYFDFYIHLIRLMSNEPAGGNLAKMYNKKFYFYLQKSRKNL